MRCNFVRLQKPAAFGCARRHYEPSAIRLSEGVMAARTRKYVCECGFQVVAHQEEELLEIVQFHMKGAHGKIVTPDAVLAASPPA